MAPKKKAAAQGPAPSGLPALLTVGAVLAAAHAAGIPMRGFYIGAAAAMIGAAISHPLDLLKVRLQVQDSRKARVGFFGIAAALYREGGLPAFFTGVSATLLRQFFYSGTRFAAYEALRGQMASVPAASLAGVAGALVGSPAEVALVRLQAGVATGGVLAAITQVAQKEGLAALWAGFGALAVRAVVVTCGQLACYDFAKELLRAYLGEGPLLHFTASVVAGFSSAAFSNPVDVVKTRLQTTGSAKYNGVLSCVQTVLREEGPRAFLKGITATCMRMVPYVSVMLVASENLNRLF